jgi:hypothetical protein
MLRSFIFITLLLPLLLVAQKSFAAVVRVEVKEFDNQTMLVFHHDRMTGLTPSILGGNGRVRATQSLEIKLISGNISNICSGIKVDSSKRNTIDFRLNNIYRFVETIHGESFVAFKLYNTNKPTTKPDAKEVEKPEAIEVPEDKKQSKISDITVKVTDTKNSKQLIFPFSDKNIGAAVFQRGLDLWVVFDNRKEFYIANSSFMDSWSQYSDTTNTIMKITLKQNLAANIQKQGNNWAISLSSKASTSKQSLNPELVSDILVSVKQVGSVKNIVTIRDPSVGDLLMIVPLQVPGLSVQKERGMVDYKILSSSQGIAISLISEDVKTTYNNITKSIDISSRYTMPSTSTAKDKKLNDGATILPIILSDIDQANFLQTKRLLLYNIVNAENDAAKGSAQLSLGEFYFTHTMYHEALAMFARSEATYQGITNQLVPAMMKSISLIFTDQGLDARTILTELKRNYGDSSAIHEIELWDRYNEYLLGNMPAETIGVADNKLLSTYTDKLYWNFVFAELELLLDRKNAKSMDALINSVRETKDISISNNIKYYKARYYYLLNQANLAQQLLEEIEKNAQNGREFMIADLQLVKILYEQKKLDWISAVERLNDLRFVWRGDKLEMQNLLALGLAYKQNNDIVNAIRTYKYIVDAFGRQSDNNFFVTSQIVELYHRIFLSDEMQELDDFSVVSLFYEFKEFTPIGIEGDRVVLGIARRMLNLDLLEMAEAILEHQVMYRLRGVERMVTANHLALVFLMDRKPVEGLKVLDDTDNENFGFAEHQKRRYLKAKALIDMKKYDEALEYVGIGEDEDATTLKMEILFRSQKWGEYVKFTEDNIKHKLAAGDVVEGAESQDILRLAISYSMLNRTADLEYLQKHIITENTELRSVVEFLRSTNEPINPHNLDKSLNIDKMQNFLDEYRKLLFN